MSGFESIGQIMLRAIKRGKVADELLALQVREKFAESLKKVFVNKKLPQITASKFNFGTLTILVPDPAWSYTLRQKEAQILKNLNLQIGKNIVQKLKFKILAK